MKKIISMLVLVLLVSGCVETDLFGLSSSKAEVKEQPPDVISIQNINILPTPPIIAGDQFSISFELSNLEEEKDVDVGYRLMDDGLCNLVSSTGGFCSGGSSCYSLSRESCSAPCFWDLRGDVFPEFVPGRVEFVEWTFNTPSNEEIGYLRTTCPIRFIIGYEFTAISEIEANVITEQRYQQLQQSGEFTTFTPTINVERGPIKIYMEFGASLPIRASTSLNQRVLPVYVTVQDKGTGLLSEIPEYITDNRLVIDFPDNFGLAEGAKSCGERFTCNSDECWNIQNLTMVKRESPTIKCSFITPDEGDVVLEKTYFITASLKYPYNLTQKVDVAVEPLEA
jgi:hypothetical protein